MKQVTIRRCPVCHRIRGLTDEVTAALKNERGVQVKVVDGATGEFDAELDGRPVYQLKGEMLPSADEVVAAVRSQVGVGA